MTATLLDHLRTLSAVDCDTLDADVAASLGPFVDCTSNQAIAFAELTRVDDHGKPLHNQFITRSLHVTHWLFEKQADATFEELAVELMMVGLSLEMAPHTTGYLHVQTNPKLAYDTQKTIKNAERLISHVNQLSSVHTRRICIKIPSTWEGLQACRELEKRGITTLATIVFSLEQTALAAAAGCRYIAPYVNELRVHFDSGYTDPSPALPFTGAAQAYLNTLPPKPNPSSAPANRTQVLAASLTSIEQVTQLAGIAHITVSPPLLAELAATPVEGWAGMSGVGEVVRRTAEEEGENKEKKAVVRGERERLEGLVGDEAGWRTAFSRAEGGECERKLVEALGIFVDVQDRLEELVREAERERRSGEV
ncbi:uncharacterized protein B0H64DRAFT_403031 [Chaetomium fimeti]|uniref:Transaldolase n=1 Tax=Chaetomium fimeti TaxID=1854472 RepID=A0AAE0LPR5_9PEZI|nr:hypothetical protein B0H64DRAFT_403031 [Chaetomium fimeti]